MLQYIAHQMFIYQTLVLLAGIHQAAVADAVDTSWDSCGLPVNLIQCFIGKDFLPSPGIDQMGTDVPFSF